MNKKHVDIDRRASKEMVQFPEEVLIAFKIALKVLTRNGCLVPPYGKKIDQDLYEIRIQHFGQWRFLYSYFKYNWIVILSAFQKKSQRTPLVELKKARKRMREYL